MVHIRTIHTFPGYVCKNGRLPAILDPSVEGKFTGHADKTLRASILNKLRQDIVNGRVTGEPAFWVKIPIPEAHENHELGPFDENWVSSDCEVLSQIKKLAEDSIIGIT